MKGFKNVKAYVKAKGIITTDIGIENGKISAIGTNIGITESLPYSAGQVVLPGFIDEHIHGAAGFDAMDGTEEALSAISNALVKEGTTAFLATTMTQSKENITRALKNVKSCMKNQNGGAKIMGVHLEGPFISEKHIGAQPLKYLKDPDVDFFNELNAASGNNIRLITLAPEERGADALIKAAVHSGTTVSAGHTDAGVEQIEEGIKAGLSCVTHTYNAMRGLHHRQIGTVGAAMIFDELYSELILDLIHVSAPAAKLLIKNKPKDKIILITDAMRAKSLADGISELGGQTVIVKNGEARLSDGTLAGSVLKMNDAIKNAVLKCGINFTDAVDFATINPANNLGLKGYGEIKVGNAADFTVIDGEFNVCATVVNGKTEYKA